MAVSYERFPGFDALGVDFAKQAYHEEMEQSNETDPDGAHADAVNLCVHDTWKALLPYVLEALRKRGWEYRSIEPLNPPAESTQTFEVTTTTVRELFGKELAEAMQNMAEDEWFTVTFGDASYEMLKADMIWFARHDAWEGAWRCIERGMLEGRKSVSCTGQFKL